MSSLVALLLSCALSGTSFEEGWQEAQVVAEVREVARLSLLPALLDMPHRSYTLVEVRRIWKGDAPRFFIAAEDECTGGWLGRGEQRYASFENHGGTLVAGGIAGRAPLFEGEPVEDSWDAELADRLAALPSHEPAERIPLWAGRSIVGGFAVVLPLGGLLLRRRLRAGR